MMQKLLIQFLGVPGSGKTTFSKQLADKIGAVTFNSDATRIAIWGNRDAVHEDRQSDEDRLRNNKMTFGAMDYMVAQTLRAGYSVVYDRNANKRRDRKDELAKLHDAKLVIVYIKTPANVAIQRLQLRDDTHDSMQMDQAKAAATYERFSQAIEPPTADELVIEISGEVPFDEQFAVFQERLLADT